MKSNKIETTKEILHLFLSFEVYVFTYKDVQIIYEVCVYVPWGWRIFGGGVYVMGVAYTSNGGGVYPKVQKWRISPKGHILY